MDLVHPLGPFLFMTNKQTILALTLLSIPLLYLGWGNHFSNPFHFDDAHTIVTNPAIRSLRNIPKLFVDPSTFSVFPPNQAYRPLLTTTLAIDYHFWGLNPVGYQIQSYAWFLLLLGILWYSLYELFLSIYWSWLGTMIFALHPITAETVNYVIQRGEIIAAVGVLLWFGASKWKYLTCLSLFAKPLGIVGPIMEWVYTTPKVWSLKRMGCMIGIYLFIVFMSPHLSGGAISNTGYWITQPYVWLRMFKQFLLPTELSADTDLVYLRWDSTEAIVGDLFVVGLVVGIFLLLKHRYYLVAFGLGWFCITLLPTSIIPIAEVTNDHRMFLPLIGLVIAFLSAIKTLCNWVYDSEWYQLHFVPHAIQQMLIFFMTLIICGEIQPLRARNQIWSSDTTLWYDVILKCPHSGRARMNYGLVFMAHGDYPSTLYWFKEAEKDLPAYWALEVNEGILYDAMGQREIGTEHWKRAKELAPELASGWDKEKRWNQ